MNHAELEEQFMNNAAKNRVHGAENDPILGETHVSGVVVEGLGSSNTTGLHVDILTKVYGFDVEKILGGRMVTDETFPLLMAGFSEFLMKKVRQEEAEKTAAALRLLESKLSALELENKTTNNLLNTLLQNLKELKTVEKPSPLVVETTPFDKVKFGLGFAELMRMIYLNADYPNDRPGTSFFHPLTKHTSKIAQNPDAAIQTIIKLADDSSKGPSGFVGELKRRLTE